MKKVLFLMMALMTCFVSQSQISTTKTKTLAKGSLVGMVFTQAWSITEVISGEDTLVSFSMVFQNAKYQHIADFGSVVFTDKESLIKFCDEVQSLGNADFERGSTLRIDGDGYSLTRNDSLYVYLFDKDGKYTPLSIGKIKNGFQKIRINAELLK